MSTCNGMLGDSHVRASATLGARRDRHGVIADGRTLLDADPDTIATVLALLARRGVVIRW